MRKTQFKPGKDTRFRTFPQMQEKYQLSRDVIERLAKGCNAKIKIGSAARYDDVKFEEYFKSFEA